MKDTFQEICDKIGYKARPNSNPEDTIFLPCFKNTVTKHLYGKLDKETLENSEYNKITEHLSDPIGFLHNLIK